MPGPGALVESTESLGRPALLHLLHARARRARSIIPPPPSTKRSHYMCVCHVYSKVLVYSMQYKSDLICKLFELRIIVA